MSEKYSIKMSVVRETEIKDKGASRFFGIPYVPSSMKDNYIDDFFYLAQIRLSDIAELDTENILPHDGYLYLVVDAEMYPSDALYIYAEHTDEEPDTQLYGLNSQSQVGLTDDISYAITFSRAAPDEDCTRLLGVPSGNREIDGKLLLQYKPSDFTNVPFYEKLKGYIYVYYEGDDVFDTYFAVDRS